MRAGRAPYGTIHRILSLEECVNENSPPGPIMRSFVSFGPRPAALLVISALVLLALAAPPAGAYLYWSGQRGIARADLNGRAVKARFIPYRSASFDGLAVGGGYVYFGAADELIGRASLDHDTIEPEFIRILLPGQLTPSYADEAGVSLALGGGYIYWAGAHDRIGRATLDGAGIDPGFIEGLEWSASSAAVYGSHIYWTSEAGIGRADLNGRDVEQAFIPLSSVGASALAVAGGYIYWTGEGSHDIGRARIDGGKVDRHFITRLRLREAKLVADGHFIYWQEHTLGPSQWIGRANINGRDVRRRFIDASALTGEQFGGGLAIDTLGPGG